MLPFDALAAAASLGGDLKDHDATVPADFVRQYLSSGMLCEGADEDDGGTSFVKQRKKVLKLCFKCGGTNIQDGSTPTA